MVWLGDEYDGDFWPLQYQNSDYVDRRELNCSFCDDRKQNHCDR